MNADGSGLVSLTGGSWSNDSAPAFSPDGSRIAFVSDRAGNAEIFVMDADGTDVARVTNNPAQDFYPAFSADGARIAFASDRVGGIGRIHVMRADGSAPTLLTSSDTSSDEDPSFSPDGTKVAFAADFVCPPGYGCGQIRGRLDRRDRQRRPVGKDGGVLRPVGRA